MLLFVVRGLLWFASVRCLIAIAVRCAMFAMCCSLFTVRRLLSLVAYCCGSLPVAVNCCLL